MTVPARTTMRVHAEVPEALRVADRPPSWLRRRQGVPAPVAFLEGPVGDGAGGLYMVDVAWGRVLHLDKDGRFTVVVEYAGEPNGLARVDENRLLVADYQRGLVAIDDLSGDQPRVSVLADSVNGDRFLGLNDLIAVNDGSVYATDQGDSGLHDPCGRLIRIDSDGSVRTVVEGLPSPNGLLLEESTQTVYVAMTRDNAVWRIPLDGSGVHRVGRYIQMSGGVGPDGMAAGPRGTMLVAHLGLGIVWVYDTTGSPIIALESPRSTLVTNLYVDATGRVFATEAGTSTVLTADLEDELASLEVGPS